MDKNHSDQEEHEVEAIIDHRFKNGKVCKKNYSIKKYKYRCINMHQYAYINSMRTHERACFGDDKIKAYLHSS